jgi:hypothetical protein
MFFLSYESARANPKCKWCTHLEFVVSPYCFCPVREGLVAKIHHTCKLFSFVDRYTFHLRRYIEAENDRRRKRVWAKKDYPKRRETYAERSRAYRRDHREWHSDYNNQWSKEHREYRIIREVIWRYNPMFRVQKTFNYHRRMGHYEST